MSTSLWLFALILGCLMFGACGYWIGAGHGHEDAKDERDEARDCELVGNPSVFS